MQAYFHSPYANYMSSLSNFPFPDPFYSQCTHECHFYLSLPIFEPHIQRSCFIVMIRGLCRVDVSVDVTEFRRSVLVPDTSALKT
jgi:hypothetical protein